MTSGSSLPMCRRLLATAGWFGLSSSACAEPEPKPAGSPTPAVTADAARLEVTRPTVVAFFIVPEGAVDTMPDLAVEADDWNYAMATLRDSLEATGIDLGVVTQLRLRISSPGARDVDLVLGAPLASGYVFIRPGEAPCIREGGADPDMILAAARTFFATGRSPDASARERCGSTAR